MAEGPVYTTHGVSLFSGISGGSSVPMGIGIGLVTTGCIARLVQEQMKAATGQRPDFQGVMMETIFCYALLGLHGYVAHNVWATCQYIATSIYSDTQMTALSKLLGSGADRFKDYSFSVMDLGKGLKDSAVVLIAIFAWILTLLAHWQLEVLQVCVFNVVYAFAPFLIGLSLWGFGGRRLWFSALVEVSSWSVTMAIVYKTIDGALTSYLKEASTMAFTDTKFLDTISLLAFMSSLPFIVPVLTGRLIGSSALGVLANVTAGGTMADKAFGSGRQAMQEMGGGVKPGSNDMSSHTDAKANAPIIKRPGDD